MTTYEGILKDGQIEWSDDIPPQDRPVRVRVTIIEQDAKGEDQQPSRGERVAKIMDEIAERGTFDNIDDPVEWQREIR